MRDKTGYDSGVIGSDRKGSAPRNSTTWLPAPLVVLPRQAVGFAILLAGLTVWLLMGCSGAPIEALRPAPSCSQVRLDAAQQLFLAARANMVRHYKERSAVTLQAAYYFASDAMQLARATRSCPDFDARVRSDAINMVRMGRWMRALAFATMRDSDPQIAQTLLQEQYSEVFSGGRDLDD